MISGAVVTGLGLVVEVARAGAGFGAGTAAAVTAGCGALGAAILDVTGAASFAGPGTGGRGAATLAAGAGAFAAGALGAGLDAGFAAAALAFGAGFAIALGFAAGAFALLAGLAALGLAFGAGFAAALGFAAFGLAAGALADLGLAGEDFLAWATDLALAAFLRRSASVVAEAFFTAAGLVPGLVPDLLPVLPRLAVLITKPLPPLPWWLARALPGSGKHPAMPCHGMRASPPAPAAPWVPFPGPGLALRGPERGSPSPYR